MGSLKKIYTLLFCLLNCYVSITFVAGDPKTCERQVKRVFKVKDAEGNVKLLVEEPTPRYYFLFFFEKCNLNRFNEVKIINNDARGYFIGLYASLVQQRVQFNVMPPKVYCKHKYQEGSSFNMDAEEDANVDFGKEMSVEDLIQYCINALFFFKITGMEFREDDISGNEVFRHMYLNEIKREISSPRLKFRGENITIPGYLLNIDPGSRAIMIGYYNYVFDVAKAINPAVFTLTISSYCANPNRYQL